MSIAFKCTSCGKALRAAPENAGKKIKCPGCATVVPIPAANGGASAAPPKPAAKPASKPAPAAASKTPPPPTTPAPGAVATCTACGAKVRTKPEWAGKAIKCPKCQAPIKIPAAAAPPSPIKPAAKPKPAPPPVEDDDPFAPGGFAGGGFSDDPADDMGGGGGSGIGDEDTEQLDDADETAPASRSARPSRAPAPKKKGGIGFIIPIMLVLLLLGGGAGAYVMFFMDTSPGPIKGIATNKDKTSKVDPKDDDDPDPKTDKDPKVVSKDGKVDPKDPKDPVDPKDPKDPPKDPKVAPAASAFDLVPGTSAGFFTIKMPPILQTEEGKKLVAMAQKQPEHAKVAEAIGVSPTDVVDFIVSISEPPGPGDHPASKILFVASFSKAINADGFTKEIADGKAFTKKEENGLAYYMFPLDEKSKDPPMAVTVSGDKILVAGTEATIVGFLKGETAAKGPLTPMLKAAAAGKHVVFAGGILPPGLLKDFLEKSAGENAAIFLPLAEATTAQLIISAEKNVKGAVTLGFEDAEKADAARKTVDVVHTVLGKKVDEFKDTPFGGLATMLYKSVKTVAVKNDVAISVELPVTLDELASTVVPFVPIPGAGPKKDGEPKKEPEPKEKVGAVGNLKVLAKGILGYHDANKFRFPGSKADKSELSWRVGILPYLGEKELFDQFKLDEPWDSENNKGLLEKMPAVFAHPTRPAPPGHTYFRVFTGDNTLWLEKGGHTPATVRDGHFNTIQIVEAGDAVPWTKFDEIPFDPEGPAPKLGEDGKFAVIMVDGTAYRAGNVPKETLFAAVTPRGGEAKHDLHLFSLDGRIKTEEERLKEFREKENKGLPPEPVEKKIPEKIEEKKIEEKVDVPQGDAKALLSLVPPNALGFVHIRPQPLLRTAAGKKLIATLDAKDMAAAGVAPADITDVLVATSGVPGPNPQANQNMFFVVAFSKPVNADVFKDEQKFVKREAGNSTYYVELPAPGKKVSDPATVNVVISPTMVLTGPEPYVIKYLKKELAGDAAVAAQMKPMLDAAAADDHCVFAAFVPPTGLGNQLGKTAPDGVQEMVEPFTVLQSARLSIHAGEKIKADVRLAFEDAAKAAAAKEVVVGLLPIGGTILDKMVKGAPPEAEKIAGLAVAAYKSITPDISGKSLVVTAEAPASVDELAALVAPMLEQVQSAAGRAQGANNLRQMGLAMHNHHAAFNKLPPAKLEKGGLSWRVAILPFLEQEGLATKFKLDEAWDSEANKALLAEMPKVFEHPTRKAPPGHTFYRVIVGPGTIFGDGSESLSFARIADGTSNTLLIVEAESAVPWTKFDEVVFDPKGKPPVLGEKGRFGAVFADGHVQFLDVPAETLTALITAAGGEVVNQGIQEDKLPGQNAPGKKRTEDDPISPPVSPPVVPPVVSPKKVDVKKLPGIPGLVPTPKIQPLILPEEKKEEPKTDPKADPKSPVEKKLEESRSEVRVIEFRPAFVPALTFAPELAPPPERVIAK